MFDDPDFSGPLFKRLSMTDANQGSANIMGPSLTKVNAPYFPKPPTTQPRDTKITAILRDDAGPEIETVRTREATIQVQDHAEGREETFLNDIPELRSRCHKGDYLILEPSTVTPRLYRVTRVSPDSPRFEAVKAAAKGRAGLLKGGREPTVYGPADPVTGISSPSSAGSTTQRARKRSGETIRADFDVTGEWPAFEVTFESADGHGRNTDYNIGVEHVLARLGELGSSLVGTRISSANLIARAIEAGVDPNFSPAGIKLPLDLASGPKSRKLRLAIGRAGAKVDSPEGSSGNTTRRMTLQVELPAPPIDLATFRDWLAGAGDGLPEGALALLGDLPAVDKAWERWIGALATGSRPHGKHRWLLAESVLYVQSPSDKRENATDVSLGIRTTGEPWTVEINAPKAAADANGTASVARDSVGTLFLVRQGRLRANQDSDGEILEDRFRALAGLTPVPVAGGNTPKAREWYVVAALDADDADIRRQTGEFVHACALARSRSRGVSAALAPMPPLFAGPETGGKFTRKAMLARPPMEYWKGHGEVSLALTARLEAMALVMHRPRHDAGYEVDGFVDAPAGPVLIEIKRGVSASDVYEGVGQLMLYTEMLGLKKHRRVLLLPAPPSQTLIDAARSCGIEIHRYDYAATGSTVKVTFPDALIHLFSVSGTGT